MALPPDWRSEQNHHHRDLSGVPASSGLTFNGVTLPVTRENGRLQAEVTFEEPCFDLPNLYDLEWKSIDSLLEVSNDYDDSAWTVASLEKTNNLWNKTTPTSLLSGDYGFHGGSLIYRGHFVASGEQSYVNLGTSGGFAYGHSVWLNKIFLGSFVGTGGVATANSS